MAPKQRDIESGQGAVSRQNLFAKKGTFSTVSFSSSEDDASRDPKIQYLPQQKTDDPGVSFLFNLKYRFSTKATEPLGHKPRPILGASCFLFLLPVPFLTACYPYTAALFGITTISSFLSDHMYSGIDSWAHTFDKVTAATVLSFSVQVVYLTGGMYWVSTCLLALACHVMGHAAAKRGDYNRFVFWHTMWHVVGVSLMMIIFLIHNTRTECMH